MKRLFFFCVICLTAVTLHAQTYVDLGLSSGTQWKSTNEKGYYNYKDAVAKYGDRLPSREQLLELQIECQWIWTDKGYKVKGPNGKSIYLPVAGGIDCDGDLTNIGVYGFYNSSTPENSDEAWMLSFYSTGMEVQSTYYRGGGCYSVRLVKQ